MEESEEELVSSSKRKQLNVSWGMIQSMRVMTVRIQGHPINISIIQVNAPTSDAADEHY